MAALIYSLCALTATLCAWLLFRAYREQPLSLLFWCGLFFILQAFKDLILVVDKLVLFEIDLSIYRYGIALIAVIMLLYGLIMRAEVD